MFYHEFLVYSHPYAGRFLLSQSFVIVTAQYTLEIGNFCMYIFLFH